MIERRQISTRSLPCSCPDIGQHLLRNIESRCHYGIQRAARLGDESSFLCQQHQTERPRHLNPVSLSTAAGKGRIVKLSQVDHFVSEFRNPEVRTRNRMTHGDLSCFRVVARLGKRVARDHLLRGRSHSRMPWLILTSGASLGVRHPNP